MGNTIRSVNATSGFNMTAMRRQAEKVGRQLGGAVTNATREGQTKLNQTVGPALEQAKRNTSSFLARASEWLHQKAEQAEAKIRRALHLNETD